MSVCSHDAISPCGKTAKSRRSQEARHAAMERVPLNAHEFGEALGTGMKAVIHEVDLLRGHLGSEPPRF